MNKKIQNNKGFALLLSLIISSIVLSIGLSMLHVTLKQLTLGSTTKGSEISFHATSAGMECLRYERNTQSAAFESTAAGGTISIDCLGTTISATDTAGGSRVNRYYFEGDWNTTDGDLCIKMDIMIVQDPTGDNTRTNIFGTGENPECTQNDVCTYALVKGHNRSCADIGNSIFTVQRELTLGF